MIDEHNETPDEALPFGRRDREVIFLLWYSHASDRRRNRLITFGRIDYRPASFGYWALPVKLYRQIRRDLGAAVRLAPNADTTLLN